MSRSAFLGLNKNQQLIAIALIVAIVVLVTTTIFVGFNGKGSIITSNEGSNENMVPTVIPTPMIPAAETVFSTVTGFIPQTVTVKKGADVNILNFSDDKVKVVTGDGNPIMNLGEVPENDEVLVKLNEVGTYNYKNEYRPEETGQIVVVE